MLLFLQGTFSCLKTGTLNMSLSELFDGMQFLKLVQKIPRIISEEKLRSQGCFNVALSISIHRIVVIYKKNIATLTITNDVM